MNTDVDGVPALLAGGAVAGRGLALLTCYDDATGERAELTAAELSGWAARVAGLLHDGCGLGGGSRAAVLLPAHWQTAAVLLGAWSAGVSVSFHLAATAGLPALGRGVDEPYDAVFAFRPRVGAWLDHVPEAHHRFVLGLAPGAAPTGDVPDGYRDFITEARKHSDNLPAYATIGRADAASVDGTTYRQWGSLASALAEKLDLRRGDRVLVDASEHEHPVKWLLAPLSVGASVVLCANLDPARVADRVATEQVTRVL